MSEQVAAATIQIDAVIFGGGAAGLWILDELHRAGYNAILLEAHALGTGQTVGSQGILHGGLKYSLAGLLTPAAKSIREMPQLWRSCLRGEAAPDLSRTKLRAEFCHIWRTGSIKSKLAMIGARAGLRTAPVKIAKRDRPAALGDCPGSVSRLDEQVIEPGSFVADLAAQHEARILKIDVGAGLDLVRNRVGGVASVRLISATSECAELRARLVVLAAGGGNSRLRERCGLPGERMQSRPLHMALVRGNQQQLPVLNGHCIDGAKTRATITTTHDSAGRVVWQVGGQIAERGVNMPPEDLLQFAKSELQAILPSVSFTKLHWATYQVDRAEAATPGSARPDEAHVSREANIITVWPTKLVLAPDLARRVLAAAYDRRASGQPTPGTKFDLSALENWPRPSVALPPWEIATSWFADL